MTIKKKWEITLPILGIEVKRSKTLHRGHQEVVWRTQGYHYYPDDWKREFRIPETWTVLGPDSIEVQIDWSIKAFKDDRATPRIIEREAITQWSHSGQMRSYESIFHEDRVFSIEWEPSSRSKER